MRAPGVCSLERILVRAPNWLGDAVMALPVLDAIRAHAPRAQLVVLARPNVAAIYRTPLVDRVVVDTSASDWKDGMGRWRVARSLRRDRFTVAILLPNGLGIALVAWLAGIPTRVGYATRGRGRLLTHAVAWPARDSGVRHQSLRYLDLLPAAGLGGVALAGLPSARIPGGEGLREAGRRGQGDHWIGVAPGSANGHAKRWLASSFAEASHGAARALGTGVVVFGSADERVLGGIVADRIRALGGVPVRDLSGATDLERYLKQVAACRGFLANDSGAMHVASALEVPTVAIFGPTDPAATGPLGSNTTVVRVPVDCGPCLKHECPLDHRCMAGVSATRVIEALLRTIRDVESQPTGP